MEDNSVGHLTWEACDTCTHSDFEYGDCTLLDEEVYDSLWISGEHIMCGMYNDQEEGVG